MLDGFPFPAPAGMNRDQLINGAITVAVPRTRGDEPSF